MNYKKLLSQFKFPLTILFILLFSLTFAVPVIAGDQEDLIAVQKRLAENKKKQQDLKSEISNQEQTADQYGSEIVKLNNEIRSLQLTVEEKQLVIDELDLKISILESQITETEEKIEQTEEEITNLQQETDKRLSDMYLDLKSFDNSVNMIFASEGSSDFIKDGLYREAIQQDTNEKLELLEQKKENLIKDKEQLKQDRIQVETDKSLLEEEKKALESNQTSLSQKRNKYEALKRNADTAAKALEIEYNNLSDAEKKLQAELELLQQRLFNSVNPILNGKWVKAGTIIGFEGSTGVSTGNHLHFMLKINGGSYLDACQYLPGKQLTNAYCGVSSPVLKEWPIEGSIWRTSPFGWRGGSFHAAVDFSSGGSAPIYAAHDGFITYGNDGACSWYRGVYPCNGAGANYAKITCPASEPECGGKTIETGYWHLK